MAAEDKLIKDRECIDCSHFLMCRGHPEAVKNCISFSQVKRCEDCSNFDSSFIQPVNTSTRYGMCKLSGSRVSTVSCCNEYKI